MLSPKLIEIFGKPNVPDWLFEYSNRENVVFVEKEYKTRDNYMLYFILTLEYSKFLHVKFMAEDQDEYDDFVTTWLKFHEMIPKSSRSFPSSTLIIIGLEYINRHIGYYQSNVNNEKQILKMLIEYESAPYGAMFDQHTIATFILYVSEHSKHIDDIIKYILFYVHHTVTLEKIENKILYEILDEVYPTHQRLYNKMKLNGDFNCSMTEFTRKYP